MKPAQQRFRFVFLGAAAAAIALLLVANESDAFSISSSGLQQQPRPRLGPTSIDPNSCQPYSRRPVRFATTDGDDEHEDGDGSNETPASENDNENTEAEEADEESIKPEARKEREDAAERWKEQARELREQIQKMEEALPERPVDEERVRALEEARAAAEAASAEASAPKSLLENKRVLLVGANGRLGSMVCRNLLREYPEIEEVVAMVHVVGENSEVSRGYGRLAYEVGAEDGRGSIGPAWSADDRTATFEFDEEVMTPYNLQKLRVVECELLDPVQCKTIVDDSKADVVVWCATDFNGSTPRAISGGSGPLSGLPFLFRAVASPDKGRVEVEGLYNMLGALKTFKQEAIQRERQLSAFGGGASRTEARLEIDRANQSQEQTEEGVDVLLVSSCPDALGNYETPFGTFLDIKRQGEDMIPNDFPSLKYSVLQFAQYEDNFVKEDLDLKLMVVENEAPRLSAVASGEEDAASSNEPPTSEPEKKQKRIVRRINRRDAARAVGEALVDPDYHNRKIQIWTNEVGN